MKLYIIRHGQTDWNIAKKIQGRQDIPLNERGHFQAQCLGKAMENRPITAVFSSPQIRAMETAIAVASPAGVPVIPVRDLMEINYGVWEGKTEEELLRDDRALYEVKRHEHKHHFVCLRCKEVFPLAGCPLERYEQNLGQEEGFVVEGHKLEIYGYCPNCKGKQEGEESK